MRRTAGGTGTKQADVPSAGSRQERGKEAARVRGDAGGVSGFPAPFRRGGGGRREWGKGRQFRDLQRPLQGNFAGSASPSQRKNNKRESAWHGPKQPGRRGTGRGR